MPQSDFDQLHDRRGTGSTKWDKYSDQSVLPLWVADMDFRSPDAVLEAISERVAHGIFGYSQPANTLKEQVCQHAANLNWQLKPHWVTWLQAVVPGLNMAARVIANQGGSLVLPTPIYHPFFDVSDHAQCEQVLVPGLLDGERWVLDFDALDQALGAPGDKMLMFCNPHNPLGRVYTRAELEQVAALVVRHNAVICSDEIHCDLIIDPKAQHVFIASLNEEIAARSITLMAPTKTYNMPGLNFAYAVIPNDDLRHRFAACRLGMQPSLSPLSLVAAQAAYRHGRPWLAALLTYLRGNAQAVYECVESLPNVSMTPVEATYLAWIDVSELGLKDAAKHFEQYGLGLSDGEAFGDRNYLRLNFGCPRSRLLEALGRFAAAVSANDKG